ncbi:hypothetical protein CPL00345_CDS0093 [Klebsiella phage GlastoCabaret]
MSEDTSRRSYLLAQRETSFGCFGVTPSRLYC